MTNHDFWMSISDIINEGFTSEGLAKLDDYAEQFSTSMGAVKEVESMLLHPYSREQKLAQINSLRQNNRIKK